MLRALRARRDPFLTCWAAHAALLPRRPRRSDCASCCPPAWLPSPARRWRCLPSPCSGLAQAGCAGRSAPSGSPALPPMLWLVAAGALAAQGTFRPAITLYAGIALLLVLGAARECWLASREQDLASARDLTLVLLAAALWYLYRMAEPFLGNTEPLTPLAGLVTFVLSSAIPFLGLAIARERAAAAETAALRRGREEVERLHAGLPAIIFLHEVLPDGTPRRLYNGGDFEAVTGWPREALAELDDWMSFAAPGTPFREGYAQALSDGTASLEWQMRRPDGGW